MPILIKCTLYSKILAASVFTSPLHRRLISDFAKVKNLSFFKFPPHEVWCRRSPKKFVFLSIQQESWKWIFSWSIVVAQSSFQVTVESNYAIVTATPSDWLKNLTPVFLPMRSQTKTNRTLQAQFFAHFKVGILIGSSLLSWRIGWTNCFVICFWTVIWKPFWPQLVIALHIFFFTIILSCKITERAYNYLVCIERKIAASKDRVCLTYSP